MSRSEIVIVGGGAAGFFAAIACAEQAPKAGVTVLERGAHFLVKVRISGGGRCNVTHACFDPRELSRRYPRGERALIAPYHQFQARDTVEWFESRGVRLKAEGDGRMFPVTDTSETVIDCLIHEAQSRQVRLRTHAGVERIVRRERGGFELTLADGEVIGADRVLLAIGGTRTPALVQLAVSLGHAVEPPVPSLFTFHVDLEWLRELAGISVEQVEAAVPGTGLRERGPLLVTHWGLSGPVILRLSAWGARILHGLNYTFPLQVNWLPALHQEQVSAALQKLRQAHAARLVVNTPITPLPARLWEKLVLASGVSRETRWSALGRSAQHALVQQLARGEFRVTGKSLNKDEFVTCGGVRLAEVDFKTMESRVCPGLHFAGEVLDLDGITGGFNFQAAWTTGWLAGRAMAAALPR